MLFLGMLFIPMKLNQLLKFFKRKTKVEVQEENNFNNIVEKHSRDEVRVLNFSALKEESVEIELIQIYKISEEDEYGSVYSLTTFIKNTNFNENLLIHVFYKKDWYTKTIEESCHMLGIDCLYDYHNPLLKKYYNLHESVRRKICRIIENNLSYPELMKLIEKQELNPNKGLRLIPYWEVKVGEFYDVKLYLDSKYSIAKVLEQDKRKVFYFPAREVFETFDISTVVSIKELEQNEVTN